MTNFPVVPNNKHDKAVLSGRRLRNRRERSSCTRFNEPFASFKVGTISSIELLQSRVYWKAGEGTNLSYSAFARPDDRIFNIALQVAFTDSSDSFRIKLNLWLKPYCLSFPSPLCSFSFEAEYFTLINCIFTVFKIFYLLVGLTVRLSPIRHYENMASSPILYWQQKI